MPALPTSRRLSPPRAPTASPAPTRRGTLILSGVLSGLGTLLLVAAPAPTAGAQTLLGVDGTAGLAWEFSPASGAPCGQPFTTLASCPYSTPSCSPSFPLPFSLGTILGDVADDPLTDTMFLTDGITIEQYTLDTPCGGPMGCSPLNAFLPPSSMGGITGMCFDNTGGVVAPGGTPLLWITDGFALAALVVGPTFSCTYSVAFGPCLVTPVGIGPITDISWDPNSGSMWACDVSGMVHNISLPSCNVGYSFPAAPACGLTTLLQGIAYDAGTPTLPPLPPSAPTLYVTDGLVVARLDVTGLFGTPTFGAPVACTPTPAFLSGLALTQHGNSYSFPRVLAYLDTYGQASTPGPTFGVDVYNAPAGANAWFILNFNFPGPGFLCPALGAAGTKIYVNPTPPAFINNIGPLPPGCVSIPLPIPSGAPVGLEVYIQIVFIPTSGPPAVDATNAVATTVMLP